VVVDVDLTPIELVLLGTAKEITILVTEIPTGIVADMRSRRLSVIIGFLVCGAAIISAGLAGSFVLLAATQVLWAFGSTFRSGAETAWYTDEVRSLARVDVVLPHRARFESAGAIIGIVGGALLASAVGLTAALCVIGSLLIAWGIVLVARMPETGFVRPPRRRRFRAGLAEGARASRRPGLRILLIVTVLAGFASEAVDRLGVARLDEIGLPESIDVSLLVGAAVVTQMVGSIIILAVFADHLAGRRLPTAMVLLNVVTGLGVAILARVDLLAVALGGMIAQGSMRDVARTATIGWTNHFTDRPNRATVHSFVGQAMSLGEISGGLVLGVVAQRLGLVEALTASAAVYLLSAAVAGLGRERWSLPARPGGDDDPGHLEGAGSLR
jgi:DHA3 family tetracycline resistance protein-like MFS transporter